MKQYRVDAAAMNNWAADQVRTHEDSALEQVRHLPSLSPLIISPALHSAPPPLLVISPLSVFK